MRYLKITLLLGAVSCLIVTGLCEAGAFPKLDRALWQLLGGVSTLPPGRSVIQYVLILILGFGIVWTTIDIYRWSLRIIVAIGALLNVISATWVLNLFYIYFSPFPSATAVALSFLFGLLYARSEAGRRKQRLRLLFGERLSRKTFYSLVNRDDALQFEGQLKEASVLVCEVFNHDELMEALSVTDYVAITNLFLQNASEFLVERGGYLDECDGESLRVIFGAPLPDGEHARTACEAAIELARRLDNLNLECETRWHKTFDHRIGVNSGEMVAAAFGSGRLGTFSVAGEAVELARRLCSANLRYGSRILIGPGTLGAAAAAVEVRPMDMVRGRDERTRIEVYELLGAKGALTDKQAERRDAFWKGIIYFREERWDDALDHFQAALPGEGADLPVDFYIRRVQQMRTGRLLQPEWSMTRV